MRRIILFAGFNYSNIVSKYVIDYLKELSSFGDVYYLADGEIDNNQLSLISPYVKGCWCEKHGGYDFYSWKLLIIKYIGWDIIDTYDELIFANDSCMCVNSFRPVFQKMEMRPELGIWGLASAADDNVSECSTFSEYWKADKPSFYIGSYFISFRKSFFHTDEFKLFVGNINIEKSRHSVCVKYEFGLTKLAKEMNVKAGCWDEFIWRYSSVYMRDAFNLIKAGFPLLKVRIFTDNIGGHPFVWDIAKGVEKFCDIDFMTYVSDIRQERNIKSEKKFNNIKKYIKFLLPNIAYRAYHFRSNIQFWKNLFIELFPPFIINFAYNILHRESIRNANHVKFSIFQRRPSGGWLPCQIENYNESQLCLIDKIKDKRNIVIFFNVMKEGISGGMLSIERFIVNSKNIPLPDGSAVICSNIPLDHACINNPFFTYSSEPIDFNYICTHLHPEKLVLNIPEVFVPNFVNGLSGDHYRFLFSIPDLRINILNQNVNLMPSQFYIEELRSICNKKLTITAAHTRYCTSEYEQKFACPIYPLKPFLPDFKKVDFSFKKNIVVLSPDSADYKKEVVAIIEKVLPDYQIVMVDNMTFDEYVNLISVSKFVFTFGEGWDGYFVEPVLSGTISFVVYNNTFFPKEFSKDCPCVYLSKNELLDKLERDLKRLNQPTEYRKTSEEMYGYISSFVNNNESRDNLKDYYSRIFNSSNA